MEAALEIVDETPRGEVIHQVRLHLASERVTAREIITRRIRQEVEAWNAQDVETLFHGLVQPTDAEAELNGYRMRKRRQLNADRQCAEALRAFERNGFFMLANGTQVEALDTEILVTPETRIAFVKLVPLVGG